MIGELAFKGLCRHATNGLPIRALFITPDAPSRKQQQVDMLNMAHALGSDNIMYVESKRAFEIGPAIAYLRIAHPFLDRELKGLEWHFIHGLDYLDAFEQGDAMRARLQA